MINISKDKEDILHIEQAKNSLDEYKQQAKINMKAVFQLDTSEKEIPLNAFLENTDHGAKHSYQVFKKALEIAQDIQNKSDTSIDTTLLYIMSGMHDSGRFRIPITKDSDTTKQAQAKIQKNKKAERDHSRYGVAQIQLGIKTLQKKGIHISEEDQQKIKEYILNHDFFNQRLDGETYHEPQSKEGQITRLADRISVPIDEEIKRYRETGKRLGTTYFKQEITRQERIDFNFTNMGNYIKNGKFDELTFFLALLSQKASDFSDPLLGEIYQQRSTTKHTGIATILKIAEEENYSQEDIQKIKTLIAAYLKHFDINF